MSPDFILLVGVEPEFRRIEFELNVAEGHKAELLVIKTVANTGLLNFNLLAPKALP